MLATRIIPCLDVDEGKVVKGIKFKNLDNVGEPVKLAKAYNQAGADELTFLDIGASHKSRNILIEIVKKVSDEVFIPLTVGGGIRSTDDMRKVLSSGADKIAICTSAIKNPSLLTESAEKFGSQCIVLSIDAKRHGNSWHAYTHGGRKDSELDAVKWAQEGEKLGAGEVLLNSIDKDGTKKGYDIELTRKISEKVNIPVIASGGAGTPEQMVKVIKKGKADAVLLASLLHYGEYTIKEIKEYLKKKGVCIR